MDFSQITPLGWLAIIAVIAIPICGFLLKKAAKVISLIICGLVLCFIFPNIKTAFLETTGMTYDSETGILSNSAGETIRLKAPKKDKEDISVSVKAILDKAGVADISSLTAEDLKAALENLTDGKVTAETAEQILDDLQKSASVLTETVNDKSEKDEQPEE